MHMMEISYRRCDSAPQHDGMYYKTQTVDYAYVTALVQQLQRDGQFIVGIRFICEQANAGCPCQH
jgi:hypothetical protein